MREEKNKNFFIENSIDKIKDLVNKNHISIDAIYSSLIKKINKKKKLKFLTNFDDQKTLENFK